MAVTGRFVLAVAVGVVAVALVPHWWTTVAWCLLVLALVGLDLGLAASPRALAVHRDPAGPVRLGEDVDAQLVVTNTGPRRLRGALRDAWSPSAGALDTRHRLDLPAGERRRLTTHLHPVRRGDRPVATVVVRSVGPLGVAARQRSLPAPGAVRVLPSFASRRHLPAALARLRTLDGSASVQLRGQGTEFDSLRDYAQGDDVRSIDWRATARRSAVVVRTWRPERDRRVLVVVDTSRTSAARIGDATRLDAAMDAALLLTAVAGAAGDRVDLLAVDVAVRASVSGVRPPGLMPAVATALAPLEPSLVETDWASVVGQVSRRMPHRGLVVLLTPLEAAAATEGLLPVLDRFTSRHVVLVGSVADPELAVTAAQRGSAPQVYTAAAAQRSQVERSAVAAVAARTGAVVVDAEPEHLAPRLVDAYLTLKAAGRL